MALLRIIAKLLEQHLVLAGLVLLGVIPTGNAAVFISEVLYNPPGPDVPNQYIELRGAPNYVMPSDTYFVAVNGDMNSNPGNIENVFDLSGQVIGGNGFLVLLQKTNSYVVNSNATVLVNTGSKGGFGSGSSSSIGHRGNNGSTNMIHAAATFLLIQSTNSPNTSADIDGNNDGVPDGVFTNWTVLDSVGVAINAGDVAYGAINFRRNGGTIVSGVVVPVTFSPDYVARTGNTTGSATLDWLAGESLGGSAPNWTLGSKTAPASFANTPLNHIGGPNFGAIPIPGVVVTQPAGGIYLLEGGGVATYGLSLNTLPAANVSIQILTDGQTLVSANGGGYFTNLLTLVFSNTTPRVITVRAPRDGVLSASPHPGIIHHIITSTGDSIGYPLTALTPDVNVSIIEADSALLNELKVHPPGTNDAPYEYVEFAGRPGMLLSNIYFLAIQGDANKDPGNVELSVNLTSARFGSNGLLVVTSSNAPYRFSSGTTVFADSHFDPPGNALPNGVVSYLLVSSPTTIKEGKDLDNGDNGILEGLPSGSVILDAVGFSEWGTNEVIYGGVIFTVETGAPDAAVRFSTNAEPRSPAAWFYGNLIGTNGDSLVFDVGNVSTNFPYGAMLTPGGPNDIAMKLSPISALSGVIGDPTNPGLSFSVADANGTIPPNLVVTVESSNPTVAASSNLTLVAGVGGLRILYVDPVGVGFSTLTLTCNDGSRMTQVAVPYAASAMGRLGGHWHTGVSDASAAIPLDDNLMLVGDDENETIRLYDRRVSGAPLAGYYMTTYLDLPDIPHGVPREVDIEASTRVGSRLFWMGSHSTSQYAETRQNRARVFATDLTGTGTNCNLTFVGHYDYLKLDLINWDIANGHGRGSNYLGMAASAAAGTDPKTPGGFNIEGLAMAPGSTTAAYVGFRAPIVPATNRTYTLIVPVLNFASLVANGGPPGSAVFGSIIELDLYGRGIRSMEGNANGYLIVGGSPGDNPTGHSHVAKNFKLYTWSGQPGDAVQERGADLNGMNPEGIVNLPNEAWTPDTQFQLLSDNGRTLLYGDGVQAKRAAYPEFRKFRDDWVALGPVVKPSPVILDTRLSSTGMMITWRALKGEIYRIQYKTNLSDSSWMDVPGDVTAPGPYASKTIPAISSGQVFYQVVLPGM